MNGSEAGELLYIGIAVAISAAVGQVLFRNGRVFLLDVFGDSRVADAVNRLFAAGFYIVTLGYIALSLGLRSPTTGADPVITMGTDIGLVLLVVGALHFINIWVLQRMRRRAQEPSPYQSLQVETPSRVRG